MQSHRVLSKNELKFITRNLKTTKTQLFWLLGIIATAVGIAAIFVYTSKGSTPIVINIIFGILILLIGALHWVFKGYKKHQLNPIVYKGIGHYQRIYEQRGKYDAYFDTINGTKIKLPWHWRRYIKQQKDQISYEYIIRDGAVAFNEHPIYIISINDVLALDYELQHGLHKTKPLSLLNIAALFIIIPTILVMCFGTNYNDALQINTALKNPSKDLIFLEHAELLSTVHTSNYIKIDSAWVYQFKKMSDYIDNNYILSKAERDRIYNHPSSNLNYRFFISSNYIAKPDKAKLKEALKNNPLSKNTLFNSLDTTIVNNTIEKVYRSQIEDYNLKVKKIKAIESVLEELKPKTFILKIYDDVFKAPKERLYSIKKSLETPYIVQGFYDTTTNRLLSFEQQDNRKKDIINAFILMTICSIITIIALFSLIKIIRNSRLKLRLTKAQLNQNNFKELT